MSLIDKGFFGKKFYEIPFFRENGFIRKKCLSCKNFFWTQNPDENLCGDSECIGGYKFIGETRLKLDFHETIEKWLSFFERNGHTRVQDYPVVARWREDLEFTIASIAAFQPWVLNGTIDPPANPLAIAQPCIRFRGKNFTDIDNVGKTGRHFTLFVMGGQHSFLSSRLKGYWMDECIRLNYDFLTKEMGLEPEEITYKEDVWSGGGNLGPCLESFGKGLEIANSVFMQFKLDNGRPRELDVKVIDVGWGIERICWFLQGTPTAYDAVFTPVIDWLRKETSIHVDEKLKLEYSKLCGALDFNDPESIERTKSLVLEKMGCSLESVESQLSSLHAIYAIADHVRTVIFAVADGAIPSNVGGGYNLRTILRRIWNLIDLYNLDIDLLKLFEKETDYFSRSYPRIRRSMEILPEILELEKKRYKTTLNLGEKYVKRLLSKKREVDVKTFVELYESKGIPPEKVIDIGRKMGLHVHVPEDFYRKMEEVREEQKRQLSEEELKFNLNGLPRTEPLYYEHPLKNNFTATVLKIFNGRYVVLNKTLFYPTSGGQLSDTGKINGFEVVRVFKQGDVIIHELKEKCYLKENQRVKGEINLERRKSLMRHHTATHIVNGAARRVLGKHVWQEGAEKTPEKARLDISHYKPLTSEEIREIEKKSNEIVLEGRKIEVSWERRDIAERKYGFSIYQGGVVPGRKIRIVNIENWDVEACGGLHCSNTLETGYIKIIGTKRIQDGIVRIEFTAGKPSIKEIQRNDEIIAEISSFLRTPKKELPKTVERFFNQIKRDKKEIEKLRKKIAEMHVEQLEKRRIKVKEINVFLGEIKDADFDELIKLGGKVIERNRPSIVILYSAGEERKIVVMIDKNAASKGFDAREILKRIIKETGGKGGGKDKYLAQGTIKDIGKLRKIRNGVRLAVLLG